jgi:TfoX/Sxy family transcriptional regulator of competence genes
MSPTEGGTMPKPSEDAKTAFTKLVPRGPTVTLRPMFGNLAAFVNGNMFAGLFGDDLFVRLPEEESAKVRTHGGRDFAPMAGRPMKGYVTVPGTWRAKPGPAKAWIVTALELTGRMPPKVAAAKKASAKKLTRTR